MNTATRFTDVQVHRYIFLNRYREHKGEGIDCWDILWERAVKAAEWLFKQVGKSPPDFQKPELDVAPTESQPFLGFDWQDSPDGKLWVSFLARIFSESAYLHLALWRADVQTERELETLYRQMLRFQLADDPQEPCKGLHLGESFAVVVETESGDEAAYLCQTIFPNLVRAETSPIGRIEVGQFPWGHLCLPREHKTPLLLVREADAPYREDASWFINVILPRLGLSYSRIRCQNQEYNRERPGIEKEVRQLAQMLHGREHKKSLRRLEQRLIELSEQLDVLAEKMGFLQLFLIRMETDLRNIRRQVNDLALHGQDELLWYVFGGSADLLVEQINVDFKNFQAYNEEAQLAFQTLQAFVDVERAKTDRKLVLMLGVVGLVLALIDGFADVFSVCTRWVIFFAGIAAGLGIWYWERILDLPLFYRLTIVFLAIALPVTLFGIPFINLPIVRPIFGMAGGAAAASLLFYEAVTTQRNFLSKIFFYATGFILIFEIIFIIARLLTNL